MLIAKKLNKLEDAYGISTNTQEQTPIEKAYNGNIINNKSSGVTNDRGLTATSLEERGNGVYRTTWSDGSVSDTDNMDSIRRFYDWGTQGSGNANTDMLNSAKGLYDSGKINKEQYDEMVNKINQSNTQGVQQTNPTQQTTQQGNPADEVTNQSQGTSQEMYESIYGTNNGTNNGTTDGIGVDTKSDDYKALESTRNSNLSNLYQANMLAQKYANTTAQAQGYASQGAKLQNQISLGNAYQNAVASENADFSDKASQLQNTESATNLETSQSKMSEATDIDRLNSIKNMYYDNLNDVDKQEFDYIYNQQLKSIYGINSEDKVFSESDILNHKGTANQLFGSGSGNNGHSVNQIKKWIARKQLKDGDVIGVKNNKYLYLDGKFYKANSNASVTKQTTETVENW